jgi:HPt (histidine-containing phosphotransfer) domain-containing protein
MANLFDDPAAQEIQNGYLANTAARVEEMIAHVETTPDDLEPIQGFAHQMKGSGQAMRFPALSDIGRQIEEAAKSAVADRVKLLLQVLPRLVSRFQAQFE